MDDNFLSEALGKALLSPVTAAHDECRPDANVEDHNRSTWPSRFNYSQSNSRSPFRACAVVPQGEPLDLSQSPTAQSGVWILLLKLKTCSNESLVHLHLNPLEI